MSSSGVAWRRQYQRYAHLLVATWLGVYVYSPLGDGALFGLLTQAVAFPFLVASGLLLWKGRALRRWVAPSRRRPSR